MTGWDQATRCHPDYEAKGDTGDGGDGLVGDTTIPYWEARLRASSSSQITTCRPSLGMRFLVACPGSGHIRIVVQLVDALGDSGAGEHNAFFVQLDNGCQDPVFSASTLGTTFGNPKGDNPG